MFAKGIIYLDDMLPSSSWPSTLLLVTCFLPKHYIEYLPTYGEGFPSFGLICFGFGPRGPSTVPSVVLQCWLVQI
jgi:hypothetical protein